MTIPQWPFSRARPPGYADGDVPGPVELTQIDEQLSRAANGQLWSDVALLKNFGVPVAIAIGSPASLNTLIYDPKTGAWLVFGGAVGAAKGDVSLDGGNTWGTLPAAWTTGQKTGLCSATDGLGKVVVGINPGSATAAKIRSSSDLFATAANANVGAADTHAVTALMYSVRLGLWIAGLDDGSIWTSPDAATWTSRHGTDAFPKSGFAESGDRILAVHNAGGTTGSLTSLDGLTWSAIVTPNIPATLAGPAVCFVPQPSPGYFVLAYGIAASGGACARSVDGAAWAASTGASFPTKARGAVAYGRMIALMGNDGAQAFVDTFYSLDIGQTWKRGGALHATPTTAVQCLALGDRFMALTDGDATPVNLYRGIAGGL